MMTINWKRLAEALEFYKARGFTEVAAEWHVPKAVHDITCGEDGRMFHLKDYGVLVGSAEQSLIGMQLEGRLPPGRYVALTPCFRDEGPERDDLHRLHFMKVELYSTLPGDDFYGDTEELCRSAMAFMKTQTAQPVSVDPTDEGVDLTINGIEVGSYSCRSHGGITWTCGTGLAEPRFSMACQRPR